MSFEAGPPNPIEGLSHKSQQALIGAMQGLIHGIGFGGVFVQLGPENIPTARVEFTAANDQMDRFLAIPDFNEQLVSLTANPNYIIKDLPEGVEVYQHQFMAADGEIYNIKAKKFGQDQYLYTINEVVLDIDPLTGLGTSHSLKKKLKEIEVRMDRRLRDDEIRRERRLKNPLEEYDETLEQEDDPAMAVIFVDLDNLKTYNDKFGHNEGDQVIKDVAAILKMSVREVDFIARTGGDEYVIVLEETDAERLQVVRERIEHALFQHNRVTPSKEKMIGLSIGVASNQDDILARFCSPEDNITPETIKMIADQKMYVEKKAKKMIEAIRGSKSSPQPAEPGYIPFLERIFHLEKDEAWRLKQEHLGTVANTMLRGGLFGEVDNPESIAMNTIIREAMLFQDLFAIVKDEDFSLIDDEETRQQKIEEANARYTEVAPVNKIHPELARDFILRIKEAPLTGIDMDELAQIVEYQHTWVDGTMSPYEPDPSRIPLAAKWLSLINAYVGMVNNRYGRKKTSEQALVEIEKGKGIQFDIEMADNFIRVIREDNENYPWNALRMG
jgi:diguanylate cyclase (GGDEF)-like protein